MGLLTNRLQLGVFLLAVSAAVAASTSKDPSATSKWFHVGELLIAILTGATAGGLVGAAKFDKDAKHEEDLHAKIRMASGRYPAYQRRQQDKEEGV